MPNKLTDPASARGAGKSETSLYKPDLTQDDLKLLAEVFGFDRLETNGEHFWVFNGDEIDGRPPIGYEFIITVVSGLPDEMQRRFYNNLTGGLLVSAGCASRGFLFFWHKGADYEVDIEALNDIHNADIPTRLHALADAVMGGRE